MINPPFSSQSAASNTQNYDQQQQLNSVGQSSIAPQGEFLKKQQGCQGKLERFFLLSIDLLCIAGFDGYFKCLNSAWSKTLGYTTEELLAKPYLEFVHPDDFQITLAEAQKLKEGNQNIEFQNRYRCQDGSYRWLSWNATVVTEEELIYCVARDITQQKHKEEQLHQRQKQLTQSLQYLSHVKSALDASAIVAITDAQGTITQVNTKFCQLSQYSRAELLGKDHRLINSGYHSPKFFKDLWSTIAQGKLWRGEIKNQAKDGSYYWVDTTIIPFLDDCGQPWQYLAICFDITARKQIEEQLRQKEERWQLALQGNNDGIWDWNLQTNEVFFSTRWKSMLGYEEHEITNHLDEWSKRVHPEDLDSAVQDVQNHLAQKTEFYINEHRVQCKDGSYKWILDRGKALWDEVANPIRMVGSHTNITERKQAQAKEHQLQTALENAVEGIAFLDTQGYYLQVNQAYAKIAGYSPEEMIGMNWQVTVHPEDLELMVAAYQQMLTEGKVEAEARGVRKDGSLFYKQVVMITVYNKETQFKGHYCFLKDITRRKQTEERLRLLESVVVNANDVILIAEAEPINEPGPRIIYVNQAFTQMTGYTLEEVRDKTPRILQGKKSQRSELDKIRHALENWESIRVELINYRKDGSEFWVELNIAPVANETGWYNHWIAIQRDITERKLAEEQLRLQMSRSQLFADISLKIRQSLQLENILKITTKELQQLLDADRVLILRFETAKGLYVIEETVKPEWDSVYDSYYVDECLGASYLLQYPQGRIYHLPDIETAKITPCLADFLRQCQVKSKLVIPLLLYENLWGMIVIQQCSRPRYWTDWEIDLLQQIANQIAITLGQSYLVKTLNNFSINLKHLHRINTNNYASFDDLFNDCLTTGCEMFELSTGIISQIEGQVYRIQAVQSSLEFLEIGLEFNIKDTYCAAVVREKRTITYTQVGEIESIQDHPVYRNLQLESYIGTPIFVNDEVYGTLNFSSIQPRGKNFQIQELEAIELMAQSIGKFISAYQTEMQRQQAESALRESEVRFRTMADSAPVLLWISNKDKECTFFNQSWLKFTGRSLEQELGNGWAEGVHPHELQHCLETYDTAFDRCEQFQMEHRLRRADGQYRWILDTGVPRITSDGEFLGYIGSCIDISDRKQDEETLRKQASQQAVIAELGQFALTSPDLDILMSQIVMALACSLELECCKILELLPEQNELLLRAGVGWQAGLVGRATVSGDINSQAGYTLLSSEPVIVHDLRTETRFNGPPLLHQHKIVSGMSVVIHAKDQPFGVLGVHTIKARTFSPDDINFLQAVANILSAAIEQKQAETALQKSEKRWATLTETVPVGIFLTDVEGNCDYITHIRQPHR